MENCGTDTGPTISVSTSGFYITGNSSDATSGIAKYCYNTSDTPGKYTDVPEIKIGAYSVPRYHVSTTGTYRCHVLDTAGNHNFDTTEEIIFYTFHCNYCGQDTNSLTNHYRCPTHYSSQRCSGSATCSSGSAQCTWTQFTYGSDDEGYGYCDFDGSGPRNLTHAYGICNTGHHTYYGYYCRDKFCDVTAFETLNIRGKQCGYWSARLRSSLQTKLFYQLEMHNYDCTI